MVRRRPLEDGYADVSFGHAACVQFADIVQWGQDAASNLESMIDDHERPCDPTGQGLVTFCCVAKQ